MHLPGNEQAHAARRDIDVLPPREEIEAGLALACFQERKHRVPVLAVAHGCGGARIDPAKGESAPAGQLVGRKTRVLAQHVQRSSEDDDEPVTGGPRRSVRASNAIPRPR